MVARAAIAIRFVVYCTLAILPLTGLYYFWSSKLHRALIGLYIQEALYFLIYFNNIVADSA